MLHPARLGGATDDTAIVTAELSAVADVPAGKQGQQVTNARKIQSLFAHEAKHGCDPCVVELGEVSGPLRRLQGDQDSLALVKSEEVYGDFEMPSNLTDFDFLWCADSWSRRND
jgi:hypothetical protein